MDNKIKINYQEYCDKVKGCYLGKNIGGTLGRRPLNAIAACMISMISCKIFLLPYRTTT